MIEIGLNYQFMERYTRKKSLLQLNYLLRLFRVYRRSFLRCKHFWQYKGVLIILRKNWRFYGGWYALITSPYLFFALLVSFITYFRWSAITNDKWFDVVLSVMPDMLGFTFAGFAILLAFSNDIRTILCGSKTDKPSPFMNNVIAIVHFLIIQTLSLSFAAIIKPFEITSGFLVLFGVFLFYYAIFLALAAILALLRIASYIDKIPPSPPNHEGNS